MSYNYRVPNTVKYPNGILLRRGQNWIFIYKTEPRGGEFRVGDMHVIHLIQLIKQGQLPINRQNPRQVVTTAYTSQGNLNIQNDCSEQSNLD